MFDETSRYRELPEATIDVPDGTDQPRQVRYVSRRMIPPATGGAMAERQIPAGDRVDRLTARLLGDPRLFWLLADANEVLRPEELTEEPGRWIAVELPGMGGL